MSLGQLVVEAMAFLTLVGFWVHGKRTHRVVIAPRPSVISDRPKAQDWTAEDAA